MQIHEVTAKLRPALELRHPDAEILFGATFNTYRDQKCSGVAYIRADGHPYEVEFSIQFGAVSLSEKDMTPERITGAPLTHADCDQIGFSKKEKMA